MKKMNNPFSLCWKSITLPIKSYHLLFLVLVMIHLGILGKLTIATRGWRDFFSWTCYSISRVFNIFSSLSILLQSVVAYPCTNNSKHRNCWRYRYDSWKWIGMNLVEGNIVSRTLSSIYLGLSSLSYQNVFYF